MEQVLIIVQIISAATLFVSKYYLSAKKTSGWILSITGYVFASVYNLAKDLNIYFLVTTSLALLSSYGLYKWWRSQTKDLRPFDYLVIILTLIIGLFLTYKGWQGGKQLWHLQSLGTVLFMIAFLMIGLGKNKGWWLLFIGHFLTGTIYVCLYFINGSWVWAFVFFQCLSMYIALGTLYPQSIPLPTHETVRDHIRVSLIPIGFFVAAYGGMWVFTKLLHVFTEGFLNVSFWIITILGCIGLIFINREVYLTNKKKN